MTLDNTLPVSPKHTGHSFPKTFIMDGCVYNQILNRKIHHVPWKAMDLDLLDAIMHQLTAIYEFYGSHSKATQMVSVRNKTIHKILYLVHHTTPYLSRIHCDKILYHNHLNYSVSYNIHPLWDGSYYSICWPLLRIWWARGSRPSTGIQRITLQLREHRVWDIKCPQFHDAPTPA